MITTHLPSHVQFVHAASGITRFPPNVEQIGVRLPIPDGDLMWLTVRRNDVVLEFPLTKVDREHLARLLLGPARPIVADNPVSAEGWDLVIGGK